VSINSAFRRAREQHDRTSPPSSRRAEGNQTRKTVRFVNRQNVEAERRACEIRLRSERKVGQLSAKLEKSPGARTDLQPSPMIGRGSKSDALRNAGISPRQAEDWEKLGRVPADEFEAALADRTTMPSSSGIIRADARPNRRGRDLSRSAR
jgi:hypothetical protein